MKITLVADNSTDENWGCRATSYALREILSRDHEIVGTITREVIGSPFSISRNIPPDLNSNLVKTFRRKKIGRFPGGGAFALRLIDKMTGYKAPSHEIEGDAREMIAGKEQSQKARIIVDQVSGCDAIVVNGEGEMIFTDPPRDTLLQTLVICDLASRLGKPIFYVNGMISKPPIGDVNLETVAVTRRVLRDAKFILRDHQSIEIAKELLPEIQPRFCADALFGWKDHFELDAVENYDVSRLLAAFDRCAVRMPVALAKPYIVLSGSSQAAKDQKLAARQYKKLAVALKALGLPLLLVACSPGDRFLSKVARETDLEFLPVETPILAGAAVMANARLLVSGRWHPSIMASNGGTPCVLMGSNSHKTLSLQSLLEYDEPVEYSAIPQDSEIGPIVEQSRAYLKAGFDMRKKISQVAEKMSQSAISVATHIR